MRIFNRIVRDLEICGGQPTIKGTRVLVLDILNWLKEGKSFSEILENFPSISQEDIQQIIAYARDWDNILANPLDLGIKDASEHIDEIIAKGFE